MNEQIRLRINEQLVKEAEDVCHEIGITTTSAVSMFFAQMVKMRALPFRPSNFPALDEYGVTLGEANKAEEAAIREIRAGKNTPFAGKL